MKPFRLSEEMKKWLTSGDPSIDYLLHRDLLNEDQIKEYGKEKAEEMLGEKQKKIAREGWGMKYLAARNEGDSKYSGQWDMGFYQQKWKSSHYTLLELKNIGCAPMPEIRETINLILDENHCTDGGVTPYREAGDSDTCVNGMFLNYATYFATEENRLKSIVDDLIEDVMPDGGFNCQRKRSGARHSSLHSTICVLEGIESYIHNGYGYRIKELREVKKSASEFILMHRLYKSDRTGKVIHKSFTMLSYPCRWRYDILRGMIYFAEAGIPWDERMSDALALIIKKRRKDGRWPVQNRHPGKVYFEMEKTGGSSRMNTYRVLKVLKTYWEDTKVDII
jgi:hypothetical protein